MATGRAADQVGIFSWQKETGQNEVEPTKLCSVAELQVRAEAVETMRKEHEEQERILKAAEQSAKREAYLNTCS